MELLDAHKKALTPIVKSNVKRYRFYKEGEDKYMLQIIWYWDCKQCGSTEYTSPWYPISKEDLELLLNIKVV